MEIIGQNYMVVSTTKSNRYDIKKSLYNTRQLLKVTTVHKKTLSINYALENCKTGYDYVQDNVTQTC